MSADTVDPLLERLSRGEPDAVAKVFRAYEPYLRRVVRRQLPGRLRAKFDSTDIVQSVWADVVRGLRGRAWHFPDAARLRAFLVKMTRNRFIDRVRHHQVALDHEEPLAGAGLQDLPGRPEPRPSEVVRGRELWQEMLALCPPAHHEVLRLRRLGVPVPEIAVRTGLHADSIHRILRTLARRLALKQAPVAPAPGAER
jgi:RNA polymerase sigma factor (sigma-70 family)